MAEAAILLSILAFLVLEEMAKTSVRSQLVVTDLVVAFLVLEEMVKRLV